MRSHLPTAFYHTHGLVGSLLLNLVLQGKLEIDNDNRVIGAIAREELVGQAVSKAIFTVQAATTLGAEAQRQVTDLVAGLKASGVITPTQIDAK